MRHKLKTGTFGVDVGVDVGVDKISSWIGRLPGITSGATYYGS